MIPSFWHTLHPFFKTLSQNFPSQIERHVLIKSWQADKLFKTENRSKKSSRNLPAIHEIDQVLGILTRGNMTSKGDYWELDALYFLYPFFFRDLFPGSRWHLIDSGGLTDPLESCASPYPIPCWLPNTLMTCPLGLWLSVDSLRALSMNSTRLVIP